MIFTTKNDLTKKYQINPNNILGTSIRTMVSKSI